MLTLKPRSRAAAASSLTTTTAFSPASCNIRCFGNWGASGAWGAWVVVLCLSRGNQFQHVSTRGGFVGLESRRSNQLSLKCLSWISNCSLKMFMFWIFMDFLSFLSCCFYCFKIHLATGHASVAVRPRPTSQPWTLRSAPWRSTVRPAWTWRDAWRDAEKGKQLHSVAWRDQRKSLEFYWGK